jgi:succinyl-CoA synthetase beta subunit
MLLLEHEGKDLLREHGIATPRGVVVDRTAPDAATAFPLPAIAKAQVPAGGRGKAGAILTASTSADLKTTLSKLFDMEVKGYPVHRVLVEEQKPVKREYYLGVIFDGEEQLLLIGKQGGVDVELFYGAGRNEFATVTIDPVYGLSEFKVREALATLSIEQALRNKFIDIGARLARLFRTFDATLVEINPLAELSDGNLIALDAKIVIDDGALFRQPRFVGRKSIEAADTVTRRMRELEIQYFPLGGSVGLVGSGAGCGVTIMDWVAHEGGKLAAFVDLDYAVLSGRTEDGLRTVLDHYHSTPAVRSIIVNFTACGVRVDLIAESLVKVLGQAGSTRRKPMSMHFQGNRSETARTILRQAGYAPFENLGDAVRAATVAAREA